jgi:hypothetical protein
MKQVKYDCVAVGNSRIGFNIAMICVLFAPYYFVFIVFILFYSF